jgi:hypothetical protein
MSDEGASTVVTELGVTGPGVTEPGVTEPDVTEPVAAEPPMTVRTAPPDNMFVPVAEQLDNVRRWNEERGWGFAQSDFDAVDVTPSDHPEPLVVDVIAVYLPGVGEMDAVRRTCHELWTVAAEQHPGAWCWDERTTELKQVRLLRGIVHRPGVRRVTVDLGAHWQPPQASRSLDIRCPESAHAEILAAAAHFPRWVRAMDGQAVPYVWLSGYQVTLVDYEAWRRLPCLSWNEFRGTLSLTAHWADIFGTRWASPVCVTSP